MNNSIKIEKNISNDKLKSLNIFSWPIWTKEKSSFPWTYDSTENCFLLDGKVEVYLKNGEKVFFEKGDYVTFTKGLSCTWNIIEDVKKHYNFE